MCVTLFLLKKKKKKKYFLFSVIYLEFEYDCIE